MNSYGECHMCLTLLYGTISQMKLQLGDFIQLPVPASFNDLTTNASLRDYVGWSWYQTSLYVPTRWQQERYRQFIHFASAHYFAKVWMNGIKVGEHHFSHLPFQVEVTKHLIPGFSNILTVAMNNTLTNYTFPQGVTTHETNNSRYQEGYTRYRIKCDYFDYSGLNRPVTLFTTPSTYIKDIEVRTEFIHETGILSYTVHYAGPDIASCHIDLIDAKGKIAAKSASCSDDVYFHNVKLWWPVMSPHQPGYLYTVVVWLKSKTSSDVYRLPIGFRTLNWNSTTILLNDEPLYLHGLGMHEDSEIRGRGFDYSTLIRDMSLLGWLGANVFRTSHYPYAEETIMEADKRGILVILEASACGLDNFDNKMLAHHKAYMAELFSRDKNHPSVIMWSLANEPLTNDKRAGPYFRNLVGSLRHMDPTRPITFVTSQSFKDDRAMEHMDIICVNRYSGWYSDSGHLEVIAFQTTQELTDWHEKFTQPVVITEYGAGSLPGLTRLPSSMWSEDYQAALLSEHFKAFNLLRDKGFLAGELIWNFIDFNTPQEYIRPGQCAKGLFTRNRQPKAAAYIVRARYRSLGEWNKTVLMP